MLSDSLPAGWARVSISEISIKAKQRKPSSDEDFVYIDIGSIDRKLKTVSSPQRIVGAEAPSRARKVVEAGDVLVSLTRPNLNAVALVTKEYHNQIASTGFEVIKPVLVNSQYIFGVVRSTEFIHKISGVVQGALYPAAKASDVQSYELPLPPLAEQKVIADKLNTLLAQVEVTKARLERIPKILKRFRQSVLSAAVSKRLTEDFRPESQDKWEYPKIRDVGKIQLGRQRSPKFHSGKNMKPYLRVQNVFEDHIDTSDVMFMEFSEDDFERYKLLEGDILLNEGQSPKFLGRPAIYRGELPDACFTNTLIRFRAEGRTFPEYALIVFRNHMHSGRYIEEGTITTNIAHLGLGRFGSVEFPLPSLEEQREITKRVDKLFSCVDRIERQANSALRSMNNLTQSILAKAFRGELTEQWRKDNPDLISGENSAEALLQRIKAEREQLSAQKPKRQKKSKQ